MTQTPSQDAREIEVRPCFDATGTHRTSWDICYRPEPEDKGVAVIASCYGPREQAEQMAAAIRNRPAMPVLMSQEWLDQKVASDPDSECEVRSTIASPAGEVGEMVTIALSELPDDVHTELQRIFESIQEYDPHAIIRGNKVTTSPDDIAKVMSRKWLDPECCEDGCQSLVWKRLYESAVKGRADFRNALRAERLAASDTEAMRLLREVRGYVVAVVEAENKKFNRDHLARIDAELAKGGAA